MKKNFLFGLIIWMIASGAQAQVSDEDALFLKKIHDYTLTDGKGYEWLRGLCETAPGRLAGSEAYDRAVNYSQTKLKEAGFDTVYLQACEVNYWRRGKPEKVEAVTKKGEKINLAALSLGNSEGTKGKTIEASVIEVKGLDEVDKLGRSIIEGKIVFYNRPMDPTQIRTFNAYGGAVDQRVFGASKAAEYGAIGVIVRSMTTRKDNHPHTGTLAYKDGIPKIPAMAISTIAADQLSTLIKDGEIKSIQMTNDCGFVEKRQTHTVIAELKGTEYPNEIILVGGHLDSWDVGQGAHDDGAGCVQSMEVLNTLLKLGYKPKRTIRCVLFANEENGLAGGLEYARVAKEKGEFHLAAIESDAGGFVPRGFSFDAHSDVLIPFYQAVTKWLPLFESYGLYFETGGSGADIGPLKDQKGLLVGLRPDSQRYFDYHHTDIDNFDAINKRELELGAAAMASLVYLIDKYGLEK